MKAQEVHQIAYNKPYDINPRDWIGALFQRDKNPQHTLIHFGVVRLLALRLPKYFF